jgi:glycosyltransferase involved in cell wall biosynthesis
MKYIKTILIDANSIDKNSNPSIGINALESISIIVKNFKNVFFVISTSKKGTYEFLMGKFSSEVNCKIVITPNFAYRKIMFPLLSHYIKPDISLIFDKYFQKWHYGYKIGMMHDLAYMRHPELYESTDLNNQLFTVRKTIFSCDHLCCVSKSTANDVYEYFKLPFSKMSILPPSIPIIDCKKNEIYSSKKRFFLILGLHHKRKNHSTVVKAYHEIIEKHPEIEIMITGNDPGNSAIGMHYLGYVSESEKEKLIKKCIALIFPSHYEGFGQPILEALRLRAQVISANNSSMPEVGGKFCHYFKSSDYLELANAMLNLIENINSRNHGFNESLDEHLMNFTEEATIQRYSKLFNVS